MSKFFLISLVIASFFFSHALCYVDIGQLISQVCQKSLNEDYCAQILTAYRPPAPGGILGLTTMTVRASVDVAKETLTFLQDSTVDPTLQRQYAQCLDNYRSINGSITDANNAFDKSDYKTMVNLYQQADKTTVLCQSAIDKLVPVMRERNGNMRTLISMAIYELSTL